MPHGRLHRLHNRLSGAIYRGSNCSADHEEGGEHLHSEQEQGEQESGPTGPILSFAKEVLLTLPTVADVEPPWIFRRERTN
jgi:hypothetical protein